MSTIAIANEKGGVGKTTSAVNVAACLAELGERVLLIDLDPQANATTHCGVEIDASAIMTALLTGETTTTSTPWGFELVSGGRALANAEAAIGSPLGVMNLRDALSQLTYEHILIDCPPTLGFLTTSAMIAADRLLVPVQTQAAALLGLAQLHQTIREVQRVNAALDIIGVLPTHYDQRRNLDTQTLAALEHAYPERILSPISSDVRVAEAIDRGQPVTHYAAESRGAREYRAASTTLLERLSHG